MHPVWEAFILFCFISSFYEAGSFSCYFARAASSLKGHRLPQVARVGQNRPWVFALRARGCPGSRRSCLPVASARCPRGKPRPLRTACCPGWGRGLIACLALPTSEFPTRREHRTSVECDPWASGVGSYQDLENQLLQGLRSALCIVASVAGISGL